MQTNKKEDLKKIVLETNYPYSMWIYKLIQEDRFEKTIKKIDNVGVPCNVNPKEITSADEQFLQLLNRFINFFNNSFYFLHTDVYFYITRIIDSNYSKLEKYLLSKHYLGDNSYIPFFQDSAYRIIVTNFVKLLPLSKNLQKLFKKEKIAIKSINGYTLEEILKINNLLSNIVLANHNHSFTASILFEDVQKNLNQTIKLMQKKNVDENLINERRASSTEFFLGQVDFLIKNYNKKKEYIFLFKT